MNRATASVDRTSTAVLGLALVAAGGAAVAWERGEIADGRALTAPFTENLQDAGWWPWALGAAAIVLILIGLRWLLAHLPRRSIGSIALSNSGSDGRLTVDLGTAARSAAQTLADRPGIVSASGRSVSDRGQRTIEITATLDPTATTLDEVSEAAASTRQDVLNALDGTPTSVRVLLQCGKTKKQSTRVS